MAQFNNKTVEGRRALVNHVLHENHLEGNEPNQRLSSLLNHFIKGDISEKEVLLAITKKSKVA